MKRVKRQSRPAHRVAPCGQQHRLRGEMLEERCVLSATLVSDIVNGSTASNPGELTDVGGTLFFAASDGANGRELWKSNGTAAGTVLVKNIAAGSVSSNPTQLTAVGGLLYFVADDGTSGPELWKSDGTAGGTVRVADIRVGPTGSNPSSLTAVGSTLYFSADDGIAGAELWSTGGVGAAMVKDIHDGAGASSPSQMLNFGGVLYFAASDGVLGTELWKSTGTSAGTEMVKDIRPASVGSFPSNLTVLGSALYFAANDGTSGLELWRSDGTSAGTARLADINAGAGDSSPSNLTPVGSTLFFTATTVASGAELWTSDGTTGGTVQVKDIRPGSGGSIQPSNPFYSNLVNLNGVLLFAADDGGTGIELWKSNGTAAGTVQVKDVSPGTKGSGPFYLTNVGGMLYFAATSDASGLELWQSDGTTGGTVLVQEIAAGSSSSAPGELTNVNGTLYFAAEEATHGRELWKAALGPGVIGRRAFYNNSKFDGNNVAAGAADDAAIASDKTALLPGGTATFANYTSFSRGLNGLMVDIAGLTRSLVASDFDFRIGNNNTPAGWAAAPAPLSVTTRVRAGLGGTDRVTIIWADGAIKNKWLQVTLKSTTGAGIAQPDVFYFGNAVGETGDSAAHARVNSTDEIAVRTHGRSFNNLAPIDFAWDINRDGYVNATDQILTRANSTTAATALQLIVTPSALAETASPASNLSTGALIQSGNVPSVITDMSAAEARTIDGSNSSFVAAKLTARAVDAVWAQSISQLARSVAMHGRPARHAVDSPNPHSWAVKGDL